MDRRTFLISTVAAFVLPFGVLARELRAYSGPAVTRIVIYKGRRRMYLMSGEKVLKKYKIGLGGNPIGPKQFEGDGKTPEGSYIVDRRNPNSAYHLSLGISYPNQIDAENAALVGRRPGGDIFIHGRAGENRGKGRDWTAGCISVSDRNIEKIYMMVQDGTQVDIFP